MKSLFICSDEAWKKHILNFRSSHALQIPSGHVVIGDIDPDAIAAFEADGATAFPYVLTGEKLPASVVTALAHLGVTQSDNTMTASLKINRSHPAFDPRHF
jgi:hypothetical protein